MRVENTTSDSLNFKSRFIPRFDLESTVDGEDTDAKAYLDAIAIPDDDTIYYESTPQEITGAEIRSAVNDFVTGLKDLGLYERFYIIYPFIGGDSDKHGYNLINPIDADSAFRLHFRSDWTHSGTGALPDGSTAFAPTYFNPNVDFDASDSHTAFYSRTVQDASVFEFGVEVAGSAPAYFMGLRYGGNILADIFTNGGTGRISVANPNNSQGLYAVNKNGSVNTVLRNGEEKGTSSISASVPDDEIYIGAINQIGVGGVGYSAKEVSFFSISDSMTEAESTDFYDLVQALQTALHREV